MSARKRPVHTVAPSLASDAVENEVPPETWPAIPPRPVVRPTTPPLFRPLKIYAFGPSLGRAPGNIRSINVRYEKLAPGPVGERIAVVDYDAARDCFYDPVDLDDPSIAINGGLDPSESDPRFHQQMVYAVASETLRRIEVALGRTVRRRTPDGASPLQLVIYPHAMRMANAFTDPNGRMMFGYFAASSSGRYVAGQVMYTCLSHDVIVHQTAHSVITALRHDMVSELDHMGLDDRALQEGLADITALLLHFTHRDAVLDTIQRTAGVIYRSQLDADRGTTDPPRIVAELAADNPLLALSQDFGEALGRRGGLRNAMRDVDPAALEEATEPHDRGAILVAAVFDAVFSIYQRRTFDLLRIFRAGGGSLRGNDVPEPLAARLCDEIGRIATRIFNVCWRALDFCPAVHISLGDFLRACITADFELSRDDPWGVRDAMMQAFRIRGIKPSSVAFFSEDALRWDPVASEKLARPLLETAKLADGAGAKLLAAFVEANAKALGLPGAGLEIYPLEATRHTGADDTPVTLWSTQVVHRASDRGVALIFDTTGRLLYSIPSSPPIRPEPPAPAPSTRPRALRRRSR